MRYNVLYYNTRLCSVIHRCIVSIIMFYCIELYDIILLKMNIDINLYVKLCVYIMYLLVLSHIISYYMISYHIISYHVILYIMVYYSDGLEVRMWDRAT